MRLRSDAHDEHLTLKSSQGGKWSIIEVKEGQGKGCPIVLMAVGKVAVEEPTSHYLATYLGFGIQD